MNVLFLTSRFPYPPYRGDKLKIYNIIKRLSQRGHTVSLLSFIESERELPYVERMEEFCSSIKIVFHPLLRSMRSCAVGTVTQTPFQVHYFASNEFRTQLKRILRERTVDVLHVHLIRMAQYAHQLKDIPRVLDLTDAGSLYLRRFYEVTRNPFKKMFLNIEAKRLEAYESILEQFDYSLVCSDVDRDALQKHAPNAAIELLYNGVDLDYFAAPTHLGNGTANRIIYTGNMAYYPNRDGIEYFVKGIFPKIIKAVPSVSLYIVGQSPPPEVQKLSGNRVTVTGFVEDIRKEYIDSQVAIAPIRFGAGTLNKILEPMALGVPVVATTMASQGLPVESGKDILLASNEDEFAESVISLLLDEQKRRTIAENAITKIRSNYGWDKIIDKLEFVYRQVRSTSGT